MTIKNIHCEEDKPYYAATLTINGVKHVVFGNSFVAVFREAGVLCLTS